MRSVVLTAPHLNRSLDAIRARIPDLEVYEGAYTPRGEDGCLENHKAVLRQALADDNPRLFVMEDDCEFTEHFTLERWEADAAWADAQGYDVLVGGSTRTYREHCVRAGLIEVSAFHSAHCLVYFRSGYGKALQAVQPYDLSLGRDCGLRCVVAHPFVAVQRPSYSGILREFVDYVPLYHHHEKQLAAYLGLAWPI